MSGIKTAAGLVFLVVLVSAIFGSPVKVRAEKHALLIGIGQYKDTAHLGSLEGPSYDVERLRQVLSRQGFDKITVLLDARATKRNILNAIATIEQNSRPGDKVIIYFSGHGTSFRDPEARGLPLPYASGALFPFDFTYSANDPVDAVMARLIVGQTDLRPLLSRLDKGRTVLVLFDSCFSGNAVRGIGTNRYVHLNFRSSKGHRLLDDPDIGEFKANTKAEEPYPYKNIFFISASSESEMAREISRDDITYRKIATFGNEPHGAFTDALLMAVSGRQKADLNNDRAITMEELHQSVTRIVQPRFGQTPQSLPAAGPDADRLRDSAFFTVVDPSAPVNASAYGIRIQVDDRLAAIKASLSHADEVTLSAEDPDLRILPDRGDIILTLANHHRICRFEGATPELIAQRTRRYAQILPLTRLSYPGQRHNVALRLENGPARSIFKSGEEIGFSIESEKEAYILLIDINPKGEINVLYPFTAEESAPRSAGRPLNLPKLFQIVPPYGTDIVKVFAFTQKPDGFDAIRGKESIVPGSKDYLKLSKMVLENAAMRTDVAQDTLTVVSYADDDF